MILVDQFRSQEPFPLTPNLSHGSPYFPIDCRKDRSRPRHPEPSDEDANGALDGDGFQWTGLYPPTACARMQRGGYRSRLPSVRCWPEMASRDSIVIPPSTARLWMLEAMRCSPKSRR